MKHLLLIAIIFFFNITLSQGQSFTLSDDNGPIANGSIVQVVAAPTTEIVTFRAAIKNNSTATKSLRAKKTHISILPGTLNTFCWAGNCYAPSTFITPDLLTLAPGQTSGRNDFYGDYLPENQLGTSKIRYTFFDSQNPNDSVSVVVHFVIGMIGENDLLATPGNFFNGPFPNPASSTIAFVVNLPEKVNNAKIILRNLVGATMVEQSFTQRSGTITLAIDQLKEGIYFYSLLANDNRTLKTGKLIIKR